MFVRSLRMLALSILFSAPLAASAADASAKPGVYTDPNQADADYSVQGEYTGEVTAKDQKQAVGAQIIALGSGKFHAVVYMGGLPGAGWDKKSKHEGDGETKDGITTFTSPEGQGQIKEGVMTLLNAEGTQVGQLKRTQRQSPTLGAKPPSGAVVLFDGSTPDNFAGGRLTDDKLLMEGVTSKQKFGSCTLHIEFMLPYMPAARGQGRGNSGCYLQGRYETQILDSFGLAGKNNECGGLYEIRDPDLNMCLPPLAWQTFDIDYTAARYDDTGTKTADARITVRHNGEVVQPDVALPRSTRAAPVKEGPEPGPLYLQNHGNPIRFRNIWLVEKP